MADEAEKPSSAPEPKKPSPGHPTPKKSEARRKAPTLSKEAAEPAPKPKAAAAKAPRAPRRPELTEELARLLTIRRTRRRARARFTRQHSYRYYRIGRDETWRRPRGMQSKQRRHYGYRSTVVSIGFGSPASTRGLTSTGFRPVVVATPRDIEALDVHRDAAIIARTVGTRRRLALEEVARKRGLHLLNPLVEERQEE